MYLSSRINFWVGVQIKTFSGNVFNQEFSEMVNTEEEEESLRSCVPYSLRKESTSGWVLWDAMLKVIHLPVSVARLSDQQQRLEVSSFVCENGNLVILSWVSCCDSPPSDLFVLVAPDKKFIWGMHVY